MYGKCSFNRSRHLHFYVICRIAESRNSSRVPPPGRRTRETGFHNCKEQIKIKRGEGKEAKKRTLTIRKEGNWAVATDIGYPPLCEKRKNSKTKGDCERLPEQTSKQLMFS